VLHGAGAAADRAHDGHGDGGAHCSHVVRDPAAGWCDPSATGSGVSGLHLAFTRHRAEAVTEQSQQTPLTASPQVRGV